MSGSDQFDFTAPENRPALLAVRFVVRSAVTSFAVLFVLGAVAGWSAAQWHDTRIGALLGVLFPGLAAVWAAFTFDRTNGVMHKRGP
jgi:hypothetical protein